MIYHSFFKPDEYFIPIAGYNDEYEISNYACLYDKRFNCLRIDNPNIDNGTYRTVILRNGKLAKPVMMHQLVGACFIPNPENKLIINHKDRNRRNNAVTNLEWATYSENSTHYHRHDFARARLLKPGSKVILNRTGEVLTIQSITRNKYLDVGPPYYTEHINTVTDIRDGSPEYESLIQEMIKVINKEVVDGKLAEYQRLKAKFEGK